MDSNVTTKPIRSFNWHFGFSVSRCARVNCVLILESRTNIVEGIGHEGQTARLESHCETVSCRLWLFEGGCCHQPASSQMKNAQEMAIAAELFCLSASLNAMTGERGPFGSLDRWKGTRVFCSFKKGLLKLKKDTRTAVQGTYTLGWEGGFLSSYGGLNFSRFEARSRRDRFAEEGRSM